MADLPNRVGQQLGNYRLISVLGEGGFAEVYLGEHIHLGTKAAVKVLHTQLTNEHVEAFRTEARTIAHLVHPHIVRVLDFGVEGKTPFLVMDYAPNGTLRNLHPKGTSLVVAAIVTYIKQVADALQYAHDQKLIHRDIKPENMLVGQHNEIFLSDFGIALMAQSSRYQSTKDMAGTIAYMAPEQIEAHPRPASDQYSLAIVTYEWLSGNRPFHGSFTEIAVKHSVTPPPSLCKQLPSLSLEIEQVVLTALAKKPEDRFGSVLAFATALEQANESQQPTFVAPPKCVPLPPNSRSLPTPPAQTAISPLLPSTQFAIPSPRQTSLSASTNSPANAQPIARVADEKIHIWKIGKREVVATLIGIVLCAGLSYLFNLFAPNIGFAWDRLALLILVGLLLLIPALLGMRFGPWTGLITGGVSIFIGVLATSGLLHISSDWLVTWGLVLGNALAGFVAGLTILITKRRYNIRNIVIADAIIAISVFLSVGTMYLIAEILTGTFDWFEGALLSISISAFILIFLPILLIIYNTIHYLCDFVVERVQTVKRA